MKFFIRATFITMLFLFSTTGFTQIIKNVFPCTRDSLQGQVCYEQDLRQIHAAQFNYGEQYVAGIMAQYKNDSSVQFQQMLNKIKFPVVISPDQKIYLVNGTNRLLAYYKIAQLSHHQYYYYFKVIKQFSPNRSQYAMHNFWIWMKTNNFSWLNDLGVKKPFALLPVNISMLSNDPYLSLSEWLKKSNWCYNSAMEHKVHNIEYSWADYFRSLVEEGQIAIYKDPNPTTLRGQQDKQKYIDYIKRVGVCHVNVADRLPGFCQYDQGCSY